MIFDEVMSNFDMLGFRMLHWIFSQVNNIGIITHKWYLSKL